MSRSHSLRWRRGARRVDVIAITGLAAIGLTTSARSDAQEPIPSASRALTLRDVLESTVAHHPAVGAAYARVRAARGERISAGSFGNPVLGYGVENAPFPGGAPVVGLNRETMTTATLPLESLVQRGPRTRRADALVRAAEADASGERQAIALDAARAYFRTALAQVSVDAAHDLLQWMDSVVAYNRVRAEEGVASEAELLRAELERDRVAAAATVQEAELARARSQLASFLGDDMAATQTIRVVVSETAMPLPRMDTALRSAPGVNLSARVDLSRRPDVWAARERLTSADAAIASERSMIVRVLGATVGTKQSAGTTSMVAGVSIPLPIFDTNRGQIARATAERDAAALELASRERGGRAELAGEYEAARLLIDRVASLARADGGRPAFLARADEARRIALGAYREGAVSLLQVIDAARAWGEARVTFYQTIYAQHESVGMLLAARGDDVASELSRLASDQAR